MTLPSGFPGVARFGLGHPGRAGSRSPIGARALGKSGRPDGLAQAGAAAAACSIGMRRGGAVAAFEPHTGFSTIAGSRIGHAERVGLRSLPGVRGCALLMLSFEFPGVAGSGVHPGRVGRLSSASRRRGEVIMPWSAATNRSPSNGNCLYGDSRRISPSSQKKKPPTLCPAVRGLTSKNTWDGSVK